MFDSPDSPAAASGPEPAARPAPSRSKDILTVLAFILVVGAARASVADHYHVPTGSMVPTVEIGDRVVVNKLAYGLRLPFTEDPVVRLAAPRAGDVVVLRSPEDGKTLLKRVVAVPGDLVVVLNGRLWINDRPIPVEGQGIQLIEDLGRAHPVRLSRGGGLDFGPIRVGPDQFLVLGDNRGESHDGRAFGLVSREAIFGRALSVWMREGKPCWHRL